MECAFFKWKHASCLTSCSLWENPQVDLKYYVNARVFRDHMTAPEDHYWGVCYTEQVHSIIVWS